MDKTDSTNVLAVNLLKKAEEKRLKNWRTRLESVRKDKAAGNRACLLLCPRRCLPPPVGAPVTGGALLSPENGSVIQAQELTD